MSVTLKGFKSLERKLSRLPRALKDSLEAELPKTVEVVEQEAKRLAPEDTGELRSKITTEPQPSGQHEVAVALVSNAPHSSFVEFGTSDTPAQPFMRPATDQNKHTVVNSQARATKRAIRRVAGGG